MAESFEFPFGTLKIEDGVMTGTYEKNLTIDLDLAKKMVYQRLKVQQGKKYPVLADARNLKIATKEARDYFAKEGVEGMTALAILLGGYVTVIITNLFIRFSKPLIPTKAFRTRGEAMKWLDQFVEETR